ncbi:MAG: hypothetical protein K8R41_07570 [Bacteroidales bacterium]|nr:hypothetical protein [Bacteroidales bacterium]
MKKRDVLIVFIMFLSFSMIGQTYVHTSKENVIRKRFTNFTVVNANNYVLSKTPVKYDTKKEMPSCYFTIDPILIGKEQRRFMIHNSPSENLPDGDWVMTYNKDEDDVFFSKAKFVMNPENMKWSIIPDGDNVLIYSNCIYRKTFYLGIDKEGHFTFTEAITDGAKWELIINKN